MNRLLTSTIIIILALYIANPCFAEEKDSSEHGLASFSESLLSEDSKLTAEAKTIDFKEDYQNDKIASNTTSKTSKKEEPDNSWVELKSGRKLNTLKSSLDELQNIYNKNYRAFCIGEAINNTEKAESQQKRNISLLLNISRQQPLSVYAASYIFSELLKINIELFSTKLLETEKNLTDEIAETSDEVNKLIGIISEDINKYQKVDESYKKLISKIKNNIENIKKTNSRPHDLANIGFYVKKRNNEILQILNEQIDSFEGIIDQLELAIVYSQKQIKFINQHNHSMSEKLKYIAEIRSSFKDLEKCIESYDTKQKYNYYLFSNTYSQYYEDLNQLIGKEEIRSGRINSFIKKSKFVPVHKSVDIFNAKDDLDNIFNLFALTETDEKLYTSLLSYIGEESWHCRYKDESESNKDQTEAKPKPKLIDFEED